MTYGTTVVNFNNATPFTANNAPLVANNALPRRLARPSVQATLRAMESAGGCTIAEPNLIAIPAKLRPLFPAAHFHPPA
jgi:pilus assembly protein CpaC